MGIWFLCDFYQISLKGQGRIENGSFREGNSPPHLEFAQMASEYFLRNQKKLYGIITIIIEIIPIFKEWIRGSWNPHHFDLFV